MNDEHSNVAQLLWRTADEFGERVAVSERERDHTYADLRARAAAFAARLHATGVRPGDRVAIFLERGADAITALMGVHAAGAVGLMVNEFYRPLQIEYALAHSGARTLITTDAMLERMHRDLNAEYTLIDPAGLEPATFQPVRRIAPDVAQIIYTSGSTGQPKGVVYAHGALRAGIRAVSGYLDLRADDRVATLMPFSSVYGLNQVVTAIATGATILIERALLPHQLVIGLAERGATVLAAVPPLWIQLLSVPAFTEGALRHLRIAQNAGGHLPQEIVARVRAALPNTRLFLQYGMTETFRGSYLPPEELDRRPDSMGRGMPDTELMLLDEEGRPAPTGVVGEIVHRGPTIALGYWNDPEATDRTFRPNPLRPSGTPATERVVFSGDLARRDADGFLYFVSRRDRMIKSMGFRIGPDEVADALLASGEIRETLIDAEPDAERGERIIAHVVLTETGSLDRLKRFCRSEMPAYAQPAEYVTWELIPRLPSNKYDLKQVRSGRAARAEA